MRKIFKTIGLVFLSNLVIVRMGLIEDFDFNSFLLELWGV